MANVATNKRNLMNPDELLKMNHNQEIVMVRGRKPFICNKFDYSQHEESEKLEDMTIEEQKERFKKNIEESNLKTVKQKKKEYSFKNF